MKPGKNKNKGTGRSSEKYHKRKKTSYRMVKDGKEREERDGGKGFCEGKVGKDVGKLR